MPASNAIVVASAARTPVGSFNGAFANVPAHELGAAAITEALTRNSGTVDKRSRAITDSTIPTSKASAI